ncbi:MAG: type II toxin-antitoxin system VapC family toxin [Deltaproteobacteria bacterium]|nr:type II toxin-antitoxin system VapC family toxin [Deltaproteobacteria bacterium]
MSSVFIDVNIPMYAAGGDHPHKSPSVRFLRRVAEGAVEAVTDAEVFQELLHRYRAIGRLSDGLAVYDQFRRIVPVVLPVSIGAVDDARALLGSAPNVGSRDAIHVAVMRRSRITRVASFDAGFDAIKGIRRIVPR